jgi:hypothetical protein
VDLYGPLVYRYGRKQGLQDLDAADLTQDVLRAVAGAMPGWSYDPEWGSFRGQQKEVPIDFLVGLVQCRQSICRP